MSYEQLKQSLLALRYPVETHFELFLNPFFAFFLSLSLFMGFSLWYAKAGGEHAVSRSRFLLPLRADGPPLYAAQQFRNAAVCGAVVACVTICALFLGDPGYRYSSAEANKIYEAYMRAQPDFPIALSEVRIIDPQKGDGSRARREKKESYFMGDAGCAGCEKREILYKTNPKQDFYASAEVWVSYSLPNGSAPQLTAKPPLAENILHFEKGALFNPVLLAPKSMGGGQP